MKNTIATIAILTVIVGCNTSKKDTLQNQEFLHQETTKLRQRSEIRIDSLFQKALIVLDSVEMELPVIKTPNESEREKTRIKTRKIIIRATNEKQSKSNISDTIGAKNSIEIEEIKHHEKESVSNSRSPDLLILSIIAFMSLTLLWSMRKK